MKRFAFSKSEEFICFIKGASGEFYKEREIVGITTLRIMTYNVRNSNDGSPHSWNERKLLIQQIIEKEKPDLIGTQEVLWRQVQDMETLLPEYGWIGLGRDGGNRGEFMNIYYKKERFELLEFDHFWLSTTPETIGSVSWGSACTRMATWVKLRDKYTNQIIYHLNTHLDHVSEEARVNGAEVILNKISQFPQDVPVVVTGDFNTVADSDTHKRFVEKGNIKDTWVDAEERINEEFGSFNGFKDPSGGQGRIDWILYRGNIQTKSVKINTDRPNGQYPSDHYPIIAELVLQ